MCEANYRGGPLHSCSKPVADFCVSFLVAEKEETKINIFFKDKKINVLPQANPFFRLDPCDRNVKICYCIWNNDVWKVLKLSLANYNIKMLNLKFRSW